MSPVRLSGSAGLTGVMRTWPLGEYYITSIFSAMLDLCD